MEKRAEGALEIGTLGLQKRLDVEEWKKMKDLPCPSIKHTEEQDQKFYPQMDAFISRHIEKRKRLMEEEEQKWKEDFDLGRIGSLEQKLREDFYAGAGMAWLDSHRPIITGKISKGKEVDIEHEYDRFFVESNWSLEDVVEEEELMDTENLEAGGEEPELEEAFYGGSDSVSLGQLVIRDQLRAPPSLHEMSTPKILYLCFGEYMAGNQVLYSIQALRLPSFPVFLTLKAKELAYIRGEGLPLRMGCGLFGSNIVFLGGLEGRFDCNADFITYPRKDIYAFDTKHPYTCQVFNNSSLQQGKSHPLIVQYYDKLYVLSISMLRFSDGKHFSPAFEMFDLKQGKWATLPTPEPFYWHESSRFLFRVVVGSYIFIRPSFGRVFCFDMADPSQKWRDHNFANCSELPWECLGETLTVEYGDGNWVILSCKPELGLVDGYNDPPHCRHYEWKGTFIAAHLMSKDYTLLQPFEPDMKIPHGYLPPGDKPLHVRGVEYKLVHLQGREICLIISVDRGDEFKDGDMERMQTYAMIFEFEIVEDQQIAFKVFRPASMIIDDRSFESRTNNKVGLEGAFFL